MSETIHTDYPHDDPMREGGEDAHRNADARGMMIAGVVGAVIGAAGYLIYQRLPDEQKDRLHRQVRTMIDQKVSDLRANFQI